MFGCSELKKMKKRLRELRNKKHILGERLEDLERKYNSQSWDGYNTGTVQRFVERYIKCADSKGKQEIVEICRELDDVIDEIESFVENDYAREVFRIYSKKKPKLIRISTDDVCSWDDAFGTDFDKVEKGLRHSLVGLVEEPTRYRFK